MRKAEYLGVRGERLFAEVDRVVQRYGDAARQCVSVVGASLQHAALGGIQEWQQVEYVRTLIARAPEFFVR